MLSKEMQKKLKGTILLSSLAASQCSKGHSFIYSITGAFIMKQKMIRQKGFSKRLAARLKNSDNEKLKKLKAKDIDEFIDAFWSELAVAVKEGIHISFEGWMSFFTKPVKRACRNTHTDETWITYKRRVRTKALDRLRSEAETDLDEQEFIELEEKKKA